MQPPTCRVCGAKHWSTDPHVLPDDAKPSVRQSSNNTPSVRPESNEIAMLKARIAELESEVARLKSGQPFDKTAYMRDYMRKRRANAND